MLQVQLTQGPPTTASEGKFSSASTTSPGMRGVWASAQALGGQSEVTQSNTTAGDLAPS